MRIILRLSVILTVMLVGARAAAQPQPSLSLQAGLQASQVTVEPVVTPPIPEGSRGIAARYPGDVGIENDPDVIFVESFEGSIDAIWLYRYMSQPETGISQVWWDHLVVARNYIGPFTPLPEQHTTGSGPDD